MSDESKASVEEGEEAALIGEDSSLVDDVEVDGDGPVEAGDAAEADDAVETDEVQAGGAAEVDDAVETDEVQAGDAAEAESEADGAADAEIDEADVEDEADAEADGEAEAGSVVDATENEVEAAADDAVEGDAASAAVPAPSGPKHSAAGGHRLAKKVVATVAVAVVLVLVVAAGLLAWDDSQRTKYAPQGIMLDGVTDVGGMSPEELATVVSRHVSKNRMEPVAVQVGGTQYPIRVASIGSPDVQATVERVFSFHGSNLFVRCYHRVKQVLGLEEVTSQGVGTVIVVKPEKVKKKVEAIASQANCDPVNASYKVNEEKRKLVKEKAKKGMTVDVEKTAQAVCDAIDKGEIPYVVEAVTTVTKADEEKPGRAIFIDTQSCKLTLYVGGKVDRRYDCSPGMAGYHTPTGDFTISYKDPAPVWVNPNSSWSKGMPKTIAPGATNPLGLKALALSCGGGIYIHGTTKTWALGSPDSHGCIRLSNDSICELYDLVEVGDPVFVR